MAAEDRPTVSRDKPAAISGRSASASPRPRYARHSPRPLVTQQDILRELQALRQRHAPESPAFRQAALARLKESVATARARSWQRLQQDNRGWVCARALSDTQDALIRALFRFCMDDIYAAANPSDAEHLCLVAVGGYGRGALAPGSDIDLLFVRPYKQTALHESVIEYLLYVLWDMGFKVGHATRSLDECMTLAKSDATILTAILEARYLCGDEALFRRLKDRFAQEVMKGQAEAFIAEKLAERDRRHDRAGQSRYVVEPDIKNGKGGLRDLHTLFWIGKFVYGVERPSLLVDAGVFTPEEFRLFGRCEDFLWSVRCHLHFLNARPTDRLSFDQQLILAEKLNYSARAGQKSVERFMRRYFLVAKDVGDLTRIFCACLEAQQVKKPPRSRLWGRSLALLAQFPTRRRTKKLPTGFVLDHGRLNVEGAHVFAEDPVKLIRLFTVAASRAADIHPHALSQARRSLSLITKHLRTAPDANRYFLSLLTETDDPEAHLRGLNETGVLGRFIPAFGRIVAMMQFNMYHHYTVDEHILRCLGILRDIERGALKEELPLASCLAKGLSNDERRVLYVTVFLHDIAKGRDEDHSVAGEKVARSLCPRLGLRSDETALAAWLVRHHLVMSDMAQTHDLRDPKTIADFADIVQTPQRLKLLLILTAADIRAVGPGVWNDWKGQLLRTLYGETDRLLTGDQAGAARGERVQQARSALDKELAAIGIDKTWREEYCARHYDPYWLTHDLKSQVTHARLVSRAEAGHEPVAIDIAAGDAGPVTAITVFTPDHPRLLSLMAAACVGVNANIVSAKIHTTLDGMALNTLLLAREFDRQSDEERRGERLGELIRQLISGATSPKALTGRARQIKPQAGSFPVTPEITIDNGSSHRFTIIKVAAPDRLGLLFELTDALFRLNVNIASAHVATFGERAIDAFYVTDLTGAKFTQDHRKAKITAALRRALATRPQARPAKPAKGAS